MVTHLSKRALIVVGAILVAAAPVKGIDHALPDAARYEIIAGFLYNFCKLTTWPDTAVPKRGEAWAVGVVGENPFGAALAKTLAMRTFEERRFDVLYFHTARSIKSCHVLYVVHCSPAELSAALEAVRGEPVLTVGENDDFTAHGGMIRLFTDDGGRVRFEINRAATRQARLGMSAKLLQVAVIYEPPVKETK